MIVRRTRGHTLFVVETLRGLTAGESGVPESLQAVVLARLAPGGPDAEDVLRAGAVLGAAVDPAVVAGLLDLPAHVAAQRCEHAAEARLLVDAGRAYEFANDLVQEVLYATHAGTGTGGAAPARRRPPRRRRREAVARHAAAVEDWPRAARALHPGRGADQGPVRAGRRRVDARAARSPRPQRAADPELVGPRPPRPRTGPDRAGRLRARRRRLRGRADDRAAGGRPQAGDARAARAGGRRPDRAREVRRRVRGAGRSGGLRLAETLGRPGDAGRSARQARRARRQRAAVRRRGRARQQRAARRPQRRASEFALARGLDGHKTAYAYLGRSAPLGEVVDELDPLLRRRGDLELLPWAVFEGSFAALGRAEWDAVERQMAEALELNARGGYVGVAPWFHAHLGWVRGSGDGWTRPSSTAARRAVGGQQGRRHGCWRGADGHARLHAAGARAHRRGVGMLRPADRAGPQRTRAAAYRVRCLAPLALADGRAPIVAEADALLASVVAPRGGRPGCSALDAYLCVARAWLALGAPLRARRALAPVLTAARRERWVPAVACAGLVDGLAAAAAGDPAARSCCPRSRSWRNGTACRWSPPRRIAARVQRRRNDPRDADCHGQHLVRRTIMAVDNDRLMEFLGRFVGDLGATVAAGNIVIGHRLGLYAALAQGPATAEGLAERAGATPRYVAEWLRGQAAGGYVTYDADDRHLRAHRGAGVLPRRPGRAGLPARGVPARPRHAARRAADHRGVPHRRGRGLARARRGRVRRLRGVLPARVRRQPDVELDPGAFRRHARSSRRARGSPTSAAGSARRR